MSQAFPSLQVGRYDTEQPDDLEITGTDLLPGNLSDIAQYSGKIVTDTLLVKYVGEDGKDQGALSREFHVDTISDVSKHFFQGWSPIISTLHIQNDTFITCGKIAAVSLP